MELIKRNNWIKSVIVNAVILVAVLIFTELTYETNDDFAISARIADGYPYVNFINYYLSRVLIALQGFTGQVNAYVLFQIVASFAAFVFILKIIMDQNRSEVSIVTAFAIALFSFDHYCTIQFTKTAALLMMAGMILMIDTMTKKNHWIWYVISLLFLYLGVAFRIDGLIAVIGFGGIFLIFWVICHRQELAEGGYVGAKRIVLYVVLLAFIGGCYGFQIVSDRANVSTPQLGKYKEYSELRSDIVDYPVYEYYEGNEEAYDRIGISENDLYMIDHWYFDYDGAASADNLEKILEVDKTVEKPGKSISAAVKDFIKETVNGVREMSFTGIHILMLIALALWAIFMQKPRRWPYVLAIGLMTVCLYISLYYMGRPAYRAMYVADLGATMWILYYMSLMKPEDCSAKAVKQGVRTKPAAACSAALSLIILLLAVPAWNGCCHAHEAVQNRIMSQEMEDYVDSHDDSMFIFSVAEKKSTADYATPIRTPGSAPGTNTMGTGSWGTMSPYVLEKLNEYGMDNPIKDLIDNDRAFFIGDKDISRLEEYFARWYGSEYKEIVFTRADEVDGMSVWKVQSSADLH